MNFPKDLMYAESHEWVKMLDGTTARIGITDFAQSELGDLVFVNLPMVGDKVEINKVFADVESVKAVSDIFSPVTGVISAVNAELLDAPQKINETPYDAWFIEVKDITAKENLLSAQAYEEMYAKGK